MQRRMAADSANVIFNQFSELGNYLAHYHATGRAMEAIFAAVAGEDERPLRLRAFVSATGSAGTIAAGDYLKERHGTAIAAVEALECPTMLCNGFGEHNIQGIGDKHIPLIHNVMNTDFVIAVSDRATDRLNVLFNSEVGRRYLTGRRQVPEKAVRALGSFGLSGICNVLAAIKLAKHQDLGPDDVVMTMATDGASLYESERQLTLAKEFGAGFDDVAAGEAFGEHLAGLSGDHLLELTRAERVRIFNLGYFTWVEQQGVPVEEFRSRGEAGFWEQARSMVGIWDEMIREFNARSGVLAQL